MARRRWYYYDSSWYKPTRPKEVKGGIKAQSKRGGFAGQWWGKRWIEVLESFDIRARLSRGRSYARRGQVADLDIKPGEVSAQVQGSRSTPYHVVIELKTLTKKQWKKVATALSERPIFSAKLLAGEMPEAIEEAFASAKLSLFPRKKGDLKTDCSCPDWSNPCKHIAAVYCLLGEAFDQDPFLLFRLRGMGREEFLALLGGEGKRPQARTAEPSVHSEEALVEPLPVEAERFWRAGGSASAGEGELRPPWICAALPRRLGSIPFWRGNDDFLEAMVAIYRGSSTHALHRLIEIFGH